MAARSGERRLNAAAPEFFPMRIANPNYNLCPPPHPIWQPPPLWLPPPPLPPPPPPPPPRQPPLPPHRPPSYRPAESFSRRNRGGRSRRMSAGPRNAGLPPPPPRMRVLSRPRSTAAMTESSGDDDHGVYKRIVEHRAFHPSRFGKAERRKMPLKPGHSTVMICNIPNKYTRKMLMEFLDEHCAKENKKLLDNGSSSRADDDDDDDEGSSTNNGVISAYDFLYLPFDLSRKMNLGYAFVNFTHPGAVHNFKSACHNMRWEHCGSRKICELAAASMQGKEALMKHFQSTLFDCEEEAFLPLSFSPPGRGSGMPVSQRTVGGRRIKSRTSSSHIPT